MCCVSGRRCTPFTNQRVGAGAVPPTLLFGLVLVHTFVGVGPCGHVCVLLFTVARFTSDLRPAWFHTPLWLPLFVVLLACAAWHVTYLRDSLLTRILSCVLATLYSLFKRACGGGGFSSYTPRWAGLGSHLRCLEFPFTSPTTVAWSILSHAPGLAPHTSLVSFARCLSRVRGVACNILAWV